MAESYGITAVFSLKDELSAPLNKISRNMQDISEQPQKITAGFGDMLKGAGVFTAVSKGVDILKDSLGSAVGRFDTLNQYPKVMKQMGYTTNDTQEAIKLLKAGIDGLPTTLQDITKNAQSFSILTGSAKAGAETANALNDAFLASGASSADASRGVEQYSQMLAAGKVDMQSWRTLTETMPYALNEVAKSFGFTGKSAQKDLYNALQKGTITTDQMNQKFIQLDGGVNGFASTARTATGGIGTSFTNMRNAVVNGMANTITAIDDGIKSAGVNGGIAGIFNQAKVAINDSFKTINATIKGAMPTIVSVFKTLISTIGGLVDFVRTNSNWIMPIIVGIASAVISFKTIVTAMNAVKTAMFELKVAGTAFEFLNEARSGSVGAAEALSTLAKESKIAAAAQWALNVAQSASPYVWIATAIIAVVAGLVWFFTQTKLGQKIFKDYMKTLVDVWTTIWNVTQTVWNAIVKFLSGIWNSFVKTLQPIITSLQQLWEPLSKFIEVLFGGVVAVVGTALAPIIAVVMGIVIAIKASWQTIVTAIEAFMNFIITYVTAIFNVLVAVFTSWVNVILAVITNVWNIIVTVISTFINILTGIINLFLSLITGNWSGALNALLSIADAVWAGIVGVISGFIGLIGGVISAWANGVVGIFESVWGGLVNVVGSIWNGIGSVIKSAIHIDLFSAGKAIIDGFLKGMTSTWEAGKDFVGGIAKWIKDHKGPISYDARLLIPAGNAIMDGLNQGLNDSFKDVQSNVAGMADDLQTNFSGQLSANATSSSSNYSSVELNANGSTNGLLQELVQAVKNGQVISIDGQKLIGATANGYDGALGNIMTDRSRNQL